MDKKKDIVIYSTPTCPACNMAKSYLLERGVDFRDYDVSKDVERAREMVKATGQRGVPVIIIDGHVIVGFRRARIEEVLEGIGQDARLKGHMLFDPFQ